MGDFVAVASASAAATFPAPGDQTFGDMKRDIASYYGMQDDPERVAQAGQMVRDVIDELNMKQVWIFNIVSSPTITTVAGQADYPIPSDFWKAYNARKSDNIDYQLTVLRQKTKDSIFQAQRGIVGLPYTMIVSNTFRGGTVNLFPTPDGVYSISLNYFKLITRPATDADVLDLPRPYQVVPKYGALSRMAMFADQVQQASYWQGLFDNAYNDMRRSDEDLGDEDALRFINIEEASGRYSYISPNARPRAYDLW